MGVTSDNGPTVGRSQRSAAARMARQPRVLIWVVAGCWGTAIMFAVAVWALIGSGTHLEEQVYSSPVLPEVGWIVFGVLVTLGICGVFAHCSSRLLSVVDVLRMLCWLIFAGGMVADSFQKGLLQNWPEYGNYFVWNRLASLIAIYVGLSGVIGLSVYRYLKNREVHRPSK